MAVAKDVPITIAFWDYDRVRPLLDRRVEIEGCDPNFVVLPPEECFHRAYVLREFEVSEIGFGPYLIAHAMGQSHYTALPVFLSRMFRHSAVYIRSDRDIEKPQDLRGRNIGVVEYQMSAAMWCRGMLLDDYGVRPEQIAWHQGGVNTSGRKEKFALNLPADFPLQPVPEGATLSEMLADGRLDAAITPEPPSCFVRGEAPVKRLFQDFETEERAYYQRSGVFPIMHALGVRNDVLAAHPWLPNALYTAFLRAKKIADADLFELRALKVGLPWTAAHAAKTAMLMGPDFWPYGVEKNRRTLEAMVRYSFDQGLSRRLLGIEELFAPHLAAT